MPDDFSDVIIVPRILTGTMGIDSMSGRGRWDHVAINGVPVTRYQAEELKTEWESYSVGSHITIYDDSGYPLTHPYDGPPAVYGTISTEDPTMHFGGWFPFLIGVILGGCAVFAWVNLH